MNSEKSHICINTIIEFVDMKIEQFKNDFIGEDESWNIISSELAT